MNSLAKKAKTFLLVYYAYLMEYRSETFLWALSNSLPFILMGVWIEASKNGNFALDPVNFARYFLAVFIVRQFTVVWVIWEFEGEVVEGRLSPRLLQPLDPVWHHVAAHIAERFSRLPIVVVLIAFFFILYPQAFWLPSFGTIVQFALVVALAFYLRFIIQYTIALCAFWLERASAIEQLWFLLYMFLAGTIAPLEVFPPQVRAVIEWTPFPYMVHFPAAILIGQNVNWGHSLFVMALWGIPLFFFNRWLWRRGLKHYSGMGA